MALALCGVGAWSSLWLASAFAATSHEPLAILAAAAHGAAGHGVAGHDLAAEEAEHIGAAGAGDALEHPLEIRTDMAVATFLVFLGLLILLWKFAWGPISLGLEKREAGIAASIRGAEDANLAAQAMLKEHEQRLADTANQVRAMLDEARRDAEQTKLQIIADAKTAAEAERARALHEIDTATVQALKSLAEKSANLAVELAGKIVKSKLSPAEHTRLIEDALSRFPSSHATQN
jgi:F-type H+-transporting ATPase subunit b